MTVRPAKTQISLGILADSQADLSLRWVHSHFVGFVMSRFIYCSISMSRSGLDFIMNLTNLATSGENVSSGIFDQVRF